MTHAEREAKLLVRVARLQRSAEKLAHDLADAGLDRAYIQAATASTHLSIARQALMSAIRKEESNV